MKARLSLTISIAATMLWSCQFDDVLSTPSNEGVIMVTSSLTKTESASGTSTGSTTNDNFKNNEFIFVWANKTGSTDRRTSAACPCGTPTAGRQNSTATHRKRWDVPPELRQAPTGTPPCPLSRRRTLSSP